MPEDSDICTPIADEMRRQLAQARLHTAIHAFDSQPPEIPGFIHATVFGERVNRQQSTLRRWRKRHFGPPAIRIGRDHYYRDSAPQDLLDALMKKAEAERAPPRRGRRSSAT
jgi:hypothetical protein